MTKTRSISKLLTDIRSRHLKICNGYDFNLHIEISSDDKSVLLTQYLKLIS